MSDELATAQANLAASDLRVRALSRSLSRLGWECLQADIDLVTNKARLCFKHDSGRLVTLDADGIGRVSVTREQYERHTEPVGRRGDRFLAERLSARFLGRDRHLGIRSALRSVAHYLADNAGADRRLALDPIAGLLSAVTPPEAA